MRVLVKHWRTQGVKIVCFLDDALGGCKDFGNAHRDSVFVQRSLFQAGFVANEEKSEWYPSQEVTWLGVNLLKIASGMFQLSTDILTN